MSHTVRNHRAFRRAVVPLLLTVAALVMPAVARGAATTEPAKPDRWEKAVSEFEKWDSKNSFPKDAVLFVGSSSVVRWPTRECFPKFDVINRGFGGSQTADVNRYADRVVTPYRPKVIVFYAGDNDIAAGKSPQEVFDNFKAFVEFVQRKLPGTPIIYIPIKPSNARWKLWPTMQEANAKIEAFTRDNAKLHYADIVAPMLGPDGTPRGELFAGDGLHLSDAGYKVWTDILTPLIEAAMK
ncbi:MAG: hypothetical protein JXA69_21395 [Phycisphaerae bacterium]|nr:hypothetical protein [Phycisphaerae bacterium]